MASPRPNGSEESKARTPEVAEERFSHVRKVVEDCARGKGWVNGFGTGFGFVHGESSSRRFSPQIAHAANARGQPGHKPSRLPAPKPATAASAAQSPTTPTKTIGVRLR